MKLLVGTKNPGKLEGVKEAILVYYSDVVVDGCDAESGVSDQPVNDETLVGARNRAKEALNFSLRNSLQYDLFVGIEEGIVELYGKWFNANIAVVLDPNGNEYIGLGPLLPIPNCYLNSIKENGLGAIMNRMFDKKSLNTGLGGIYNLTNNSVSRIHVTKESVIMALTSFYNSSWSDNKRN